MLERDWEIKLWRVLEKMPVSPKELEDLGDTKEDQKVIRKVLNELQGLGMILLNADLKFEIKERVSHLHYEPLNTKEDRAIKQFEKTFFMLFPRGILRVTEDSEYSSLTIRLSITRGAKDYNNQTMLHLEDRRFLVDNNYYKRRLTDLFFDLIRFVIKEFENED